MLESLLLALVLISPAGVEIQFQSPMPDEQGRVYPREGERVSLRILEEGEPVSGARLEVVYLPGSSVQEMDEVGRTRDDGTIDWTPRSPGLVKLTATVEERVEEDRIVERAGSATISVRFARLPWQGVVVMVLAGACLFGGLILSFRKLVS